MIRKGFYRTDSFCGFHCGDLADHFTHVWTPLLQLICTFIIGFTFLFGSPISCFIPIQFTGSWRDYTEHYCLLENSHYLPTFGNVTFHERRARQLSWHHWAPFFLLLSIIPFFIPCVLWKILGSLSGELPSNPLPHLYMYTIAIHHSGFL